MTREETLKVAKPIIFNTEMVRAILNGRKTMTRRVCKDANDYTVPDMSYYNVEKRTYAIHSYADKEHTDKLSIAETTCPICPGDILYIRETWQDDRIYTHDDTPGQYFYKADGVVDCHKWRPSIHMPKEAARIFLRITSVRAERLQEITANDIRQEGLTSACVHCGDMEIAKKEFALLWKSTIKKENLDKYGWEADPWVWVYEFERVAESEE